MNKEILYWAIWLKTDKFLTNEYGQVFQFTTKARAIQEQKKYKGASICRGARIQNSVIRNF
jgi:hypothetical protein